MPEDIKLRRLQEIIEAFRSEIPMKNEVTEQGKYRLVLIEGLATKSAPGVTLLTGRTDGNKRVVFPAVSSILPMRDHYDNNVAKEFDSVVDGILPRMENSSTGVNMDDDMSADTKIAEELAGRYVIVKVIKAQSSTLRAIPVAFSNLLNFQKFEAAIIVQ